MIVVHHRGPLNVNPAGCSFYYYACTDPDCGWVAPLRREKLAAVVDGQKHQQIKAATKDERR